MVNPYDSLTDSTAIIQHWWNIDVNDNYFDTTSGGSGRLEYVVDCDICDFGQSNYESLENLVALSLLLKNNKFYSVTNSLESKPLASMATRNLFDLTKQAPQLSASLRH